MRVLPWRPRRDPRVTELVLHAMFGKPGAYAGHARFQPRDTDSTDPALHPLVGHVIELQFVRMASLDERFGGQALFRRWPGQGPLVPEQDLDFGA
jgi:hypothetical protein